MRNLLVLLSGSRSSWQAAFTGYDLGARGGIRLVGAIQTHPAAGPDFEQLRREFEIGARAAGVVFTTISMEVVGGRLKGELPQDIEGALIGREDLDSFSDLEHLLGQLDCPLWIISKREELVSALAINGGKAAGGFLRRSIRMAREWGWHLESIDVQYPVPGSRQEGARDSSLEVDRRQFLQRLGSEPADLTLVPWPGLARMSWELIDRSERTLVCVPEA